MKAVRGWVTSKEPVSLKKAARIVSSFAARDNLASQDVTNYLKRAAVSFNELLHFHRELRQGRNPGSFWSDHVSAGEGEPSAGKQDAGETQPGVGRKDKKRERKPAVGDGAKVGVFNELLDAQEPEVEGRKSIVSGEAVEVIKLAGKGRKLIMDGAVEKFVEVVDGGVEERNKERRKEMRKNSDHNKLKMINREEGEEQSKKEKIKNREEGDEQSKKEKRKNREEGEEQSRKKKRRRNE